MSDRGLIDLDELALRARSRSARQYISEAVACYKAGAFRACIVSTWIAVVFDILDKFRELEMTGDKNAKAKHDSFQKIREDHDILKAQKFERELLEVASKEFELLSQPELVELQRLLADRHRCAHPTLQHEGVPYEPSAELARTHLRNAVVYLLAQQPVQGKAALDRVWKDIESEFFPRSSAEAARQLGSGPLARPRKSLVQNFVIGLTKNLLWEPNSDDDRARRFAALTAVFEMHQGMCEEAYFENLSRIVSNVADGDWSRVISLLRGVPMAWMALDEGARIKSKAFVAKPPMDEIATVARDAMAISELACFVPESLDNLDEESLTDLVQERPDRVFVTPAVRLLAASQSFQQANSRSLSLVSPLAPFFTAEDLRIVVDAFLTNSQLNGSRNMPHLLIALLEKMPDVGPAAAEEWQRLRKKLDESGFGRSYSSLRSQIDQKFELLATQEQEAN